MRFCARGVLGFRVGMQRAASSSSSDVPLFVLANKRVEQEIDVVGTLAVESSEDVPLGELARRAEDNAKKKKKKKAPQKRKKKDEEEEDDDNEEGGGKKKWRGWTAEEKKELIKSEKWASTLGERVMSRSGDILLNPTITVADFEPVLQDEGDFLKIVSWNCNGLRAILAKSSFEKYVKQESPQILCLQETKTNPEKKKGVPEMEPILGEDYKHHFWNHGPKGYSGTAVFSKLEPLRVLKGMGVEKHDSDGRLLALEFDSFWLVSTYFPNAAEGLKNLKYRQEWNQDFQAFVSKLEKPVVIVGDLNVAHNPVDLYNPTGNKKSAGFSLEERTDFSKLLESGFHDIFREENPVPDVNKTQKEDGKYTYWQYRHNAREKNRGWRVDYVLVQKTLRDKVKKSFARTAMLGSDHCPVGILLDVLKPRNE